MEDAPLVHLNGELVPDDEATVSVHDRGFRFGDAAVETVRVYGGSLFRWADHADRLRRTCELIGLEHGLAADELRSRVRETVDANDLVDARVRLSISRGVDDGRLTPAETVDPTVVVTATELPRGGVDGSRPWDGPATLQTVKTRHVADRAVPARAKTHNYMNRILARLELRATGADEALMLDHDGHVTEGTTSNVFFVADDALRTPTLDGAVLPGVTRSVVLELAREEGLPVEEGWFVPDDVRSADEAFITSTSREIRPVGAVDGIDVGGGPVTTLLSRLYDQRVERCYETADQNS
jgi:branched-chain amino acid aminotransferase